MATGQSNQQLQDDPLAELRRAREGRDAARGAEPTTDPSDPLAALQAAREQRDAARPPAAETAAPEEAPADSRSLFTRATDFVRRTRDAVFPQEEGRRGLPTPTPTDFVETEEEPPTRVGTRLERQAAGLPPIEVRRGAIPVGEIGGPDPEPGVELVRDPFSGEMVPDVAPRGGRGAVDAVNEMTDQLGLQRIEIPQIQPTPTLGETVRSITGTRERELTIDQVFAQPDAIRDPELAPLSGRFSRPFGAEPPSMRRATRMERLSASIERAGREQQEAFEDIPLAGRVALSAGRASLDAVTAGRFDSDVSGLIDKANQAVASMLGVAPPELTVEQLFSSLDRSLPEKIGGGVGFLGTIGAGIRLTNMAVSQTSRLAARGTRTRAFLQAFDPNVAATRSTRAMQAAIEGIPFDLAFEAENPQERAANLVIGLVAGALLGATPIAGKIKAADDLDPRISDPTTAIGATRTGPEALPVRRTRPEPPAGPQTIEEALSSETARLDREERIASADLAEADAAAARDAPAVVGTGRRPRVLTPENQAMHDAAMTAPDLPTLRAIIDNDPDIIAARLRPQPGDPRDTANLHSTGGDADRVWSPERTQLHDTNVRTLVDNAGFATDAERRRAGAFFEGPVAQEKILYMVTGPPAAGKSTLSTRLIQQIRGLLIDTDEMKKLLPEHDGGRAAGTVHRESSIVAHERMLDEAMDRGDNIVFPMIGKSRQHVIGAAEEMTADGYTVHIVLNELPPLEAVRRSYTRFKRSDKYIPEAYILDEVGNAPTSMYGEAVESGLFASHQRYTNDVPRGQNPRLLESGGDLPDGRPSFAETTAREPGPETRAGRLRRSGNDVAAEDARQATGAARREEVARPRGASASDASSTRGQRDLFNPEVEVRNTPPPDGPARAPEVTPRQITDPMPPTTPLGVQANGRGGFFNLGALTEGVQRGKAFLKREFTAAGDLPQRAWRLLLKSEGWFGSQMADMKFTLRRFDDALREAYGTTDLNTSQARRLNAAMSKQIPLDRIPAPMRPVVRQLRDRVDGYSQQMVDRGMVEGDLAAVFADNMGVYLSRSYKVFDTPSWILENVPQRIVNRARSWLRKERPDLNDDEITGLMESILNKQNDSPLAFLTGGTLGSKDLSMLVKRKDIAAPIRALMGEHTDVRLRYARSVTKMSRALANHGFLTEVKNSLGPGRPNALFFPPGRPTTNARGSFIQPIAAEGSKTLEPLNGMLTTPEIAAAFKRQFSAPGAQGWLGSAYFKANAIVKFDKTVLSMMTHVRNLIGNAGFATANGHWRLNHFGRAIQAVNASAGISRGGRLATRAVGRRLGLDVPAGGQPKRLTGKALEQQERRLRIRNQTIEGETPWEAYYRKLQLLGVVDSSAHAGELQAVVKDAAMKGMDNIEADPGLLDKAVRGTIRGATAIYRAEDDLWKVVAFENEFARYRKAMPDATEAEVEETAAWIVRNTYPNYGMISSGVQALRKNILVGSFVSFPAEVFRTMYHTVDIAVKEATSPNAEIRKIGATRLAGITAAATGTYAISAASRWYNGIDRQTDQDLRPFLAPWQENSSLVYTNREKDGVYSIIDLSYTDPYSYVRDPLRRLFSGDGDWVQALRESVVQAASPFFTEEILFSKVADWRRNQKAGGGSVFNEEDHPVDQTFDILSHFWDALEPGTLTSAKRIAKGVKGETNVFGQEFDTMTEFMAVVTGHRLQKTDVRQSLRFRTTELNGRVSDANSILNRVASRSGNVTDEELTDAFQRSERARRRIFAEAHDIAMKAINSHGLTAAEVRQQFRDGGMSRANAAAVVESGIPPRRVPRIDDVNRAALIRSLNQGR